VCLFALRWISTIRVLAKGNACCAGIVGSVDEEQKGASKAGDLEDGVGHWMLRSHVVLSLIKRIEQF
jgi:hypothetical protein